MRRYILQDMFFVAANHFCFMQLLRRKTAIENPGEGTSAAAMQEEMRASESAMIGENNRRKGRVVFYDYEDARRNRERKNSRSDSLRSATNLRNVRGNRRHVGAMSLVRST